MNGPASEALTGIPVVVRVAETSSFSAAARQLGMTPSGVSKAISRLEERHGVRLFDRTTRRVSLTEEGRRFYERCRRIVEDIEEAHTELGETRAVPRGTVRMTLPAELGRSHVVSSLPELLRRHSDLAVELELTDRRVDLIGERVDLALRIGDDSGNSRGRLVRRVIAHTKTIVCASPGYIEQNGHLTVPNDLVGHNVCFYGARGGSSIRRWQLRRGDEVQTVSLRGNTTVDSGAALVELARRGHGIIAVFDFLAQPAMDAGELVRLIPEWQAWQALPISLVYPRHRELSVKVTTAAQYLEEVVTKALGGDRPREPGRVG